MKSALSALGAGLLFGAGLLVSGMANPAKVIGFLDLGGHWDPSLALVMASAIAVSWLGVRFAARRTECPVEEGPANTGITRQLLGGSVLFGIGWGITGFCPGPAVAALGLGFWPAAIVVLGMVAGLWVGKPKTGAAAGPATATG
ncbi:hypothetical protein CWI75_01255 [Kineobactrum sediminis]|uniref:YeeE/YedE family protein n=1 Tax=Kineobactrum sediminis TaxID=1905677 RepID=A0A2N5Y6M1_9GAMM|nr:DUF6691 family protein [Kineobactrum sediminis]PLW84009.1 hypothetical protein CWI75_01255 [Kineobactrum sediminis]